MPQSFEREIAGRPLIFETGLLANQSNGAITVRYGETMLLVTACAADKPREGIDFLPLTVDYEERLYAAGKIPGSFFRREGRPTQEATLTMRLTDRPIRPLFPKGMRTEVQVIATALSADQINDPATMVIIGASAALSISDIPFNGPAAATRIGFVDGRLVANPTFQQQAESSLDLVVAGTKDAIIMVEAGANEVSEEIIMQGMKMAQIINVEVVELIDEMVQVVGKPKFQIAVPEPTPASVEAAIADALEGRLGEVFFRPGLKAERDAAASALKGEVLASMGEQFPADQAAPAYDAYVKAQIRKKVLQEGIRVDGRGLNEIRKITGQVGLLPRAHGSGLFTRGETQALTIATLGSLSEKQRLDTIGLEKTKRYMHHYNMPPYSNGEVKRIGGTSRRETGHGALAERALLPVVPDEEAFPYVLRLVSEIMSSNGSTSMASVCGSSLALMDAGVPIKAPVAGVAMGLVKGEGDEFAVLTDILGSEDSLGDMDFKVAGTAEGITALQMDMKVIGIDLGIITQAMSQAKEGRMSILQTMSDIIAETRPELSKYAPRMIRITINPDKIGAVIGPGGKVIRSITEETGATIDIQDDGSIFIGSASEEAAQRAISIIEGLTKEVQVGEKYTGKVVRIMNFGAFVEILPGKDGLVHISELADYRVGSVEDVVKMGDEILVMVTEIDRMGRINLSRRAVLEGLEDSGARVVDSRGGGEGSRDSRPQQPMGGGGPPRRGPGGPPRGNDRPPRCDGGGPPRRGPGGPPRR